MPNAGGQLSWPSRVQEEAAGSDMAVAGCGSVPNSANNIIIKIILLIIYTYYHSSRQKQITYALTTDSHKN